MVNTVPVEDAVNPIEPGNPSDESFAEIAFPPFTHVLSDDPEIEPRKLWVLVGTTLKQGDIGKPFTVAQIEPPRLCMVPAGNETKRSGPVPSSPR